MIKYIAWDNMKYPLCDYCNQIAEDAKCSVDMPVGFPIPVRIETTEKFCKECGKELDVLKGTVARAKAGNWVEQARIYVAHCDYPGYAFYVKEDARGAVYLQAAYSEADTLTGKVEVQLTRKWFLSPEMVKSEIVATAFKCIMTSMEHRTREWFTYRQRAIYQPHYDVDKLHEICEEREVRV